MLRAVNCQTNKAAHGRAASRAARGTPQLDPLCGLFDQAHLVGELVEFAHFFGRTPLAAVVLFAEFIHALQQAAEEDSEIGSLDK